MSILYTCLLHAFHFIYSSVLAIRSFWKRHCEPVPQSLRATRQRIPRHLAVLFTVDPTVPLEKAKDVITESIIDVVSWCRIFGIEKLTVYEKNDLLSACLEELRAQLPTSSNDIEASDSDTEYPITPPPSDYSESRPLSPVRSFDNIVPVTSILISNRNEESGTGSKTLYNRRKHLPAESTAKSDLLLCLTSWRSSTPAIANAATALARVYKSQTRNYSSVRSSKSGGYKLSVAELGKILEDEEGLSSPDFMIIHPIESSYSFPSPPELHGFPPWHIRLTELFLNRPVSPTLRKWFGLYSTTPPLPLDEISFRAALDEFSSAEMRFGK